LAEEKKVHQNGRYEVRGVGATHKKIWDEPSYSDPGLKMKENYLLKEKRKGKEICSQLRRKKGKKGGREKYNEKA